MKYAVATSCTAKAVVQSASIGGDGSESCTTGVVGAARKAAATMTTEYAENA